MQEAEVPTQIKAEDQTPDEAIEFLELKAEIVEFLSCFTSCQSKDEAIQAASMLPKCVYISNRLAEPTPSNFENASQYFNSLFIK